MHDSVPLIQRHTSNNKSDPYYASANNPFISNPRCHPPADYSSCLHLYLTDLRPMKLYQLIYYINGHLASYPENLPGERKWMGILPRKNLEHLP